MSSDTPSATVATPEPSIGSMPTESSLRYLAALKGEEQANIIRLFAIAAFYAVELAIYHGLKLGPLEFEQAVVRDTHYVITAIAVGWLVLGMVVLVADLPRRFRPVISYVATTVDLLLLTLLLCIADGPGGPMVAAYFVIVAMSGIRLSPRLVAVTGVVAVAAYLFLNGYARWFSPPDSDLTIPRYQQAIVIIALGLTAWVTHQTVQLALNIISIKQGGPHDSAS
ncbi:hypothetical protein [Calycomorphotria hydatis]|uniref:Uncharacterized protein n=1 Tax=Calycomorphotria hydatis TaxID=2528027 RepID=A0A517TB25_9PLAN|nr:hypothetical protein [Calycomorphotria hydatis]QDT65574.1 hypothetical protein V22_28290 [Calycomorphotria hydatis]